MPEIDKLSLAEIFTSEKRGNDETGNGTEGNPYKTIIRAMRHAAKEPFPPIYVDSTEEGKIYAVVAKSQLKKIQKIWVRENYKAAEKAKLEEENTEKRQQNLDEAKKIVISEDPSLPKATLVKIFKVNKIVIFFSFSLPQYWKVRVGSSYRSHGGVLHKVKKIIKHYGFDKYYYMNDIAVVVVAKKITFSQYVGQATIIKEGTELPENSVCTLIGWGSTYRDGPQPDQLQYTNMLSINNEDCKMMYSTIGAVITTSMLCAGRTDVDGVDGCFGDSGGPLIYKGVVVGLVSFGYACGLRMYPGVYTKISHYTDLDH